MRYVRILKTLHLYINISIYIIYEGNNILLCLNLHNLKLILFFILHGEDKHYRSCTGLYQNPKDSHFHVLAEFCEWKFTTLLFLIFYF